MEQPNFKPSNGMKTRLPKEIKALSKAVLDTLGGEATIKEIYEKISEILCIEILSEDDKARINEHISKNFGKRELGGNNVYSTSVPVHGDENGFNSIEEAIDFKKQEKEHWIQKSMTKLNELKLNGLGNMKFNLQSEHSDSMEMAKKKLFSTGSSVFPSVTTSPSNKKASVELANYSVEVESAKDLPPITTTEKAFVPIVKHDSDFEWPASTPVSVASLANESFSLANMGNSESQFFGQLRDKARTNRSLLISHVNNLNPELKGSTSGHSDSINHSDKDIEAFEGMDIESDHVPTTRELKEKIRSSPLVKIQFSWEEDQIREILLNVLKILGEGTFSQILSVLTEAFGEEITKPKENRKKNYHI